MGWASAALNSADQTSLRKQVLAEAGIRLDLDYLSALGLYDCCEEIVRCLRIDGLDTPYVASLLDKVASFTSAYRHSVADFLEWFDSKDKLAVSSAEGVDAVQMLTIHKAKGLGKPVVICPLAAVSDHPAEMWVSLNADSGFARLRNDLPGGTPELPTAYVSLNGTDSTLFDPVRDQERLMAEVDDLNVLYVAFTRPMERLYVFSPDHGDLKKPKPDDVRYPALLHYFCPQGWQSGDETFVHTARSGIDGELKPVVRLERISFPDWTERVRVASPAEKALTRLAEDKVRFGTYVHDLLSRVAAPGDVEAAVATFAAEMDLDQSEADRVSALAREVVEHPATARFFNSGGTVKNECELIAGGRLMRPDRLVLLPDETWVVDFKTGEPLPDHHRQVADYCKAVEDMGLPRVSGYLVYLQPEVKVVDCVGN